MLLKTADSARWVFYPIPFDDAVVEMNARVISGSGDIEYGVVLRMSKDGNNGYVFGLTNNGEYGAYLYSNQGWIDLVSPTASSAVETGTAKNRLKLIAQGNQIAFYVNDQFLNTVTDSTLSEGFGGFYLSVRNPNVKVAFSDLHVSKINRPLTLSRPQPTPTPEIPSIPTGLGGLIVINRYGQEFTFEIAGKPYKTPGNGKAYIHLPPGHYTWSADIPGVRRLEGTVDILEGQYGTQSFSPHL